MGIHWSDLFTLALILWGVSLIVWLWLLSYTEEDMLRISGADKVPTEVKRGRFWSGVFMLLTFLAWFSIHASGVLEQEEKEIESLKLPMPTQYERNSGSIR